MRRGRHLLEDLDQDIRDHIERETEDNIGRGMSPEEARCAALRKFGNVARVKEETREVWSIVWLEQLWQDVGYAARAAQVSGVHCSCRSYARAGDRRQHGDLLRGPSRNSRTSALPTSRSTGYGFGTCQFTKLPQ